MRCRGRFISLFTLFLLLAATLSAAVIETKTITRLDEAVIVTGNQTTAYYGLQINNTDVTQSPNQIFAWAYDSASGWRQVVFQIDEINNAYPNNPPPITTGNPTPCHYGRGPNHMDADDGLWDSNDELVFMSGDSGDRVSLDEWAPDASISAPRYEITVTDPQNTALKGWVYLFRYDTLPAWRTDDYVSWNETTNVVTAEDYVVDYNDSNTNAVYFTGLNVTAAAGGTGVNMVQKSKLYWYGGFALSCGSNETQIRTQQTITGGGCGNYSLPWYAKDGRVRVLRYFVWSPYCTWVTNGIGFWPCTHLYYYRSNWREDSNVSHHGGSGHTDYWWSTVNHANTATMTFYDSNGETATINGTAETMANTPLWTWYQVSSTYGSYVQVLRDTAKAVSPDSRRNLYTDSGSAQRGDAGYRIENPTETTEDVWHHFYFFFLPANNPNVGATYDGYITSPLTIATNSQNMVIPPDFAGIQTATDFNGACVDEGVRITWTAITDWRDGCTGVCSNRLYQIYIGGVFVANVTDQAATSWTHTTGTNNQTYQYQVEACNQNGNCTDLGTTIGAMDYVAAIPTLGITTTMVADHDLCVGDGIDISWNPVSAWNDDGSGSRGYDLYWDGDGFTTPLATGVTSPYRFDAPDGESHTYRIRAINGCNLGTNYGTSLGITDWVAAVPTLPADPTVRVTDLNGCSLSGVQIAWDPVGAWGDNGNGTSRYDLFWSDDGFATPIVTNATSPLTYIPGNNLAYTYRIVATNGCSLNAIYTDGSGADQSEGSPNFAGIQSVTDGNKCIQSPLTITWTDLEGDGPEGWNDGGSGAGSRQYRIYRNGVEIAGSPEADGVTSATDSPPLTNVAYLYTVVAYNLDNCYTGGGAELSGTDNMGFTPVATPGLTVARDECDQVPPQSPAEGVTITWDPPGDWGDHGTNTANRRYYFYWDADGYSDPIGVATGAATSFTWYPPIHVPYRYLVVVRNGCGYSFAYANSDRCIDKLSCAPSCTLLVNDTFDPTNDFSQSCFVTSRWGIQAGTGNGGSAGMVAELAGAIDDSAGLNLTGPTNLIWPADLKIRFWATSTLSIDDAGAVLVWTDDSPTWRKIVVLNYPNLAANLPSSVNLYCGSDIDTNDEQPAFQGPATAGYYEARLDDYLTGGTTQANIRFIAAGGGDPAVSTWTLDDVKIGNGITDMVYLWSKNQDLLQGIVKDVTGTMVMSWEDAGLYKTESFRIYRSLNPASIRLDASSTIVHTEPDTDAADYSWTSTDGEPPVDTCWFYKIYGYKDPCGESNQGEN